MMQLRDVEPPRIDEPDRILTVEIVLWQQRDQPPMLARRLELFECHRLSPPRPLRSSSEYPRIACAQRADHVPHLRRRLFNATERRAVACDHERILLRPPQRRPDRGIDHLPTRPIVCPAVSPPSPGTPERSRSP